jgi:hypothetical protein
VKVRIGLVLLIWLLNTASAWADAHSIEGSWTLEVSTPRGIQHPTLEVTAANGSYRGMYTGRRGALPIEEIQVQGNQFSFPLTVTMPMGEMDLQYSGQFNGDSMQGEIGNPRGSIGFTGKRND